MTSTQPPSITIGELLKRHRQVAELKQKELAKLLGYSDTIISRVETGAQQPQPEYVEQFIKVLQLDEVQRNELLAVYHRSTGGVTSNPVLLHSHHEDWGEAPDVGIFFGRQEELAELRQWLIVDHCRLVTVLGMGGIGKTTLVTKLSEQIKDQFDYVLWRSLRNAPPLTDLLTDCLEFLSDQQLIDLPGEVSAQINLLLEHLRQKRCLLILDNLETILQAETRAGEYRQGYEAYGSLVQRVAESAHQSCLVLTSREKPKELIPLTGITRPVRSLALPGLGQPDSRALLQDRELHGDESAWAALTQRYAGNPLALRQVSATIQDLYGGEINTFLKEITTMFGEIRYLLEQQFNRLSKLEQDIMYWLAINREPMSIPELREDLLQAVSTGELAEALESLLRRTLIEKSTGRFTLQNVIMEYVTDRLIERVSEEILLGTINLFRSHALIKATTKEYIREGQIRLLLQPLADRLLINLGQTAVEEKLRQSLSTIRETQLGKIGYIGGNAINLLSHLKCDLHGANFSHLTVSQAYLQGMNLQDVNFANADLAKSVFSETFGRIHSVAFSPDGRFLAAGTANGEIRLWQIADGRQLYIFKGHTDEVGPIAFSPNSLILASGSVDRTIRLWEVSTGQCLQILRGHTKAVKRITFSSDGHILASGSGDQTVQLWEVSTGECLHILRGHTGWVNSLVFSTDSNSLASCGDQTVRLWNSKTGQCLHTLEGHIDWVTSVALSPRGLVIASSSADRTIRLWEVSTGQCLQILRGHTDWVRSVTFSSDGRILASSSGDQTVKLWEVSTGQCLHTLYGHSDPIKCLTFSPDGHILASSHGRMIQLWEVSTGQCFKILHGHINQVESIAFNQDGRVLASGSLDQTVRLWEVSTGQCLKILQGHTNQVWSVAFSPNGLILASSSEEQAVRLWEVSTGRLLNILQGHINWIKSVAFSPDGLILASGGVDQTVKLWEVNSGRCLKTLYGHTSWLKSVAFSPSGHILASGSEDATVILWEVSTGQCLFTLRGHTSWVRSVTFSPDGCILASGSSDQMVKLWEVSTGRCLLTLSGHNDWVNSLAFSPDGHTLASGGDQTIRLWKVDTGQCFKVLQGHTNWVRSIAFGPDGHILASGSNDQTLRLWEVSTGQCFLTLQGHTNLIESVALNIDGYTLASASRDETIKLWNIQTGECVKTLRPDRPYERMNITGATGLTEAQKDSLRALGAIDLADPTTIEG